MSFGQPDGKSFAVREIMTHDIDDAHYVCCDASDSLHHERLLTRPES